MRLLEQSPPCCLASCSVWPRLTLRKINIPERQPCISCSVPSTHTAMIYGVGNTKTLAKRSGTGTKTNLTVKNDSDPAPCDFSDRLVEWQEREPKKEKKNTQRAQQLFFKAKGSGSTRESWTQKERKENTHTHRAKDREIVIRTKNSSNLQQSCSLRVISIQNER